MRIFHVFEFFIFIYENLAQAQHNALKKAIDIKAEVERSSRRGGNANNVDPIIRHYQNQMIAHHRHLITNDPICAQIPNNIALRPQFARGTMYLRNFLMDTTD